MAQGGGKRDALLEAGREVLFERGLGSATVDEITSRAGVAKGTFYLYFASKDDLVKGLREQLWQAMVAVMGEAAQRASATEDPWDMVDWVLEAIVDFDLEHQAWHRLLAGGFHNPLMEEMELEQQFLDFETTLLRDGVARGAFAVADPEYTALLLYRAVEGTLHQLCVRDEPIDRDRVLAAIRAMVHRTLGDCGTVTPSP